VLQGCEPVDILMAKRDGRFSGEAFVVLSSPLQIQMAEDKNKSYMGRRYVEVFRAKKQVGGRSWQQHSTHAAAVLQPNLQGAWLHHGQPMSPFCLPCPPPPLLHTPSALQQCQSGSWAPDDPISNERRLFLTPSCNLCAMPCVPRTTTAQWQGP
jgi:hypothetical protein